MAKFRAIIPKKLAISNMIAPIREACIKNAKDIGYDLEQVSLTWEGAKPTVQTEAKLEQGQVFPRAFTAAVWIRADDSEGYWKYRWLDEGTRVRYATMTKGFVPKTRAGELHSWAGKGKMLFVSRKHPRPGIKARKFTKTLQRRWAAYFRDTMNVAIEKAARASGHAV